MSDYDVWCALYGHPRLKAMLPLTYSIVDNEIYYCGQKILAWGGAVKWRHRKPMREIRIIFDKYLAEAEAYEMEEHRELIVKVIARREKALRCRCEG